MRIAVIGAGMQAKAVIHDLLKQPDVTKILIGDVDVEKALDLSYLFGDPRIEVDEINADAVGMTPERLGKFGPAAVLSAAPYHCNAALMAAAIQVGAHFCDLGGNNAVIEDQKRLSHWAEEAGVSVIPACGLAPGLPGHLIADAMVDFDSVESVEVRVGGLPQKKGGLLDYSLVFSVEGLFNEMSGQASVLKNGWPDTEEALTGLETLCFTDSIGPLEAFVTSGALSTLPKTFAGRIQELNYKTIRYPGHADFFITAKRLGLMSLEPIRVGGNAVKPQRVFEAVAGPALDTGDPDLIVMRTTVKGVMDGVPATRLYEMVEYPAAGLSAMMRCTAFPASIVLLMLARGEVSMKGFAPLELSIDPKKFLSELASRDINITTTDYL